jgi:hypothetical protein
MEYFKAKLRRSGDKAVIVSDRSELEIHQTNVYLYGLPVGLMLFK